MNIALLTSLVHSSDASLLALVVGVLLCVFVFSYGVCVVAVRYVTDVWRERVQSAEVRQGTCPDCDCRFDAQGVIQHGHFVQEHEPVTWPPSLRGA